MKTTLKAWVLLSLFSVFSALVSAQGPYQDPGDRNQLPYTPGFSSHDCNDPGNVLADCGFESGLGGWTVEDLTTPFVPIQVGGAGLTPGFGLFTSAPTEGTMALLHGFDGDGPGFIRAHQDVVIPLGGMLQFDYRAGWDYTFGTPTASRIFRVVLQPAGGGANLFSQDVFVADINTPTVLDTGDLHGDVDLGAFAGQNLRVIFEWEVPDNFSGPGFFQLDNILLNETLVIPTMSKYALGAFLVLLGASAVFFMRKRRLAAAA